MRTYANPPILEAICDFQFAPGQTWDPTLLGLVYDRIKTDFPQKAQAPGPILNVSFGPAPPVQGRMQFRREDGSALVQVGPDNLTVNHLRPYGGWPRYRDMIAHTLEVYRSVATPQGLTRIALRYINRLEVPADAIGESDDVQIGDYVLAQPTVPNGVESTFLNWAQRVEIPFDAAQTILVLQSGTLPASESFPFAFLLDLQMTPSPGPAVALNEVPTWLDQAHENIRTVFEQCLGPKARPLFGLIQKESVQ